MKLFDLFNYRISIGVEKQPEHRLQIDPLRLEPVYDGEEIVNYGQNTYMMKTK